MEDVEFDRNQDNFIKQSILNILIIIVKNHSYITFFYNL